MLTLILGVWDPVPQNWIAETLAFGTPVLMLNNKKLNNVSPAWWLLHQGTPGFPQTRSRTGTGPGPDRTRDTAHEYIHLFHIFWFLLCRFWLPKLEKVIKFCWFKSFQFDNSDLLVWWLWLLLDRFWLPKAWKSIQNLADSNHLNSIILIFWFGDFDSFWTGFGCQSLKK